MKTLGIFAALALFCCVASAQTSISGIVLTPGSNPPGAALIQRSTTDNPALQFGLAASTQETFTGLTVNNSGTATSTDFSQLSLYKDNNSDGQVDNGDTLVTTFASGTFPVSSNFSGNPQTIGGPSPTGTSADMFLIAIDVSAGATAGATFDLWVGPTDITASTTVSGSKVQGATQTVVVAGGGNPVDITTTTLNDGAEGQAYNEGIKATGGTSPYTWSGTGIPGFLTLDTTQTGLDTTLTGNPTTGDAGNYSFSVTIQDSLGLTDTQNYNIDIIASGSGITIITTSLPGGTEQVAYNETIDSAGGSAPYTWSLTAGSLPPGLTLDTTSTTSSTTLSGTPTSSGIYTFTVQVADGAGSDTEQYTVVIAAPGGTVGGGGGGGSSGGGCVATSRPDVWFLVLPLLALAALYFRRRTA